MTIPARPITALCFGGPLHGEVHTYLLDSGRRGCDVVAGPVKPDLTGPLTAGPVRPDDVRPPITRYDAQRAVLPITSTEVLAVHVLVDQLGIPGPEGEAAKLFLKATALLMFMRGWPGPDEGERWVVSTVPAEVVAAIRSARSRM